MVVWNHRRNFTAYIVNDEVQKVFLAETETPEQPFEYAIRREKGLDNHIQIRKQLAPGLSNQQTGIKSEPAIIDTKERKPKHECLTRR